IQRTCPAATSGKCDRFLGSRWGPVITTDLFWGTPDLGDNGSRMSNLFRTMGGAPFQQRGDWQVVYIHGYKYSFSCQGVGGCFLVSLMQKKTMGQSA
ncbi:hypothetical protein, partial [Desulfosarcina sp.]|uniref:hypothetical protein n=1 Tax=Desulfosarcina sp. TaxID=2027861 RepID=UPI003564CEBD